jgi:acetyltransferase EpsM
MADAFEVVIPLLNPNEPEVQIVEALVKNGQKISEGDVLCTVETTKSSHEILAEHGGYVVLFESKKGDKLRAGRRLCWLAGDANWSPPVESLEEEAVAGFKDGLRITRPARELAMAHGLDLNSLPGDVLITEAEVQRLINAQGGPVEKSDRPLDSSALVMYGGGGHAKALIDLVRALGTYRLAGIIDDGLAPGTEVMGIPVLGSAEKLGELARDGVRQAINAVGGIGDLSSRIRVFNRLKALGFEFPSLVHPSAWIEPGAQLQAGVQVFPHAYIGSETQIGTGVIVNTAAVVSHDCVLQEYVNIAPGALLAGNVSVGEGVLVGMGVTINLNVQIGAGAMIGNSSVVKSDVPAGQVVRAGTIWPVE